MNFDRTFNDGDVSEMINGKMNHLFRLVVSSLISPSSQSSFFDFDKSRSVLLAITYQLGTILPHVAWSLGTTPHPFEEHPSSSLIRNS